MSADRARLTHHAPRKYREVVSQQGRVQVEADANEAARIVTEEARREALDLVGSCGTPDNGFQVAPSGAEFLATPGTMYVGGLRVTQNSDVVYSKQSEWLDIDAVAPWADGLWQDPALFQKLNVQATLVLREQELGAVEDPALREVALGGPDTAARTRLLQRIVAVPTSATTCAAATKEAVGFWSGRGLIFDSATAALEPRSRLLVTPVTNAPPPSPCDPPAASGYLGADNQLIRVMITAFDGATDTGTLLWGYHNASILYRATVESPTTVRLGSRPVSAEYQPRTGQTVQLLSRAAALGEGAFAAALTGHAAKLTTPYAADTQIVTMPAAVPQPPYANGSNIYVRLWEDQVPFTVGQAVELAGTGLKVTISRLAAGPLHVGNFWCIGVRPLTPNAVYPERLLTTPQPPDGPRMWACPLAVLQAGKPPNVAEDCRLPFDNLVELTARKPGKGESCACTVCVSPEAHLKDAPSLQKAVDMVTKSGGTICLEPGDYPLRDTLRIRGARSIRILGKGTATRLFGDLASIDIFESADVTLEAFSLVCMSPKPPAAILLRSSTMIRLERLQIDNNNSDGAAVGLSGALKDVLIRTNLVSAQNGVVSLPGAQVGATGLVDLRIEDNDFLCQSTGIELADVTVHQHVTAIVGNRFTRCENAGIVLIGVTVPGFGVDVIGNQLAVARRGIVAGVDGLRLKDNDLGSLEPPALAQEAITLRQGLTDAVLEDGQIVGNRIRGFELGIRAATPLKTAAIVGNQISEVETGLLLEAPVDTLTIDRNQVSANRSAVVVDSGRGRVALTGNQVEIFSGSPGVLVRALDGDCVYADNHSNHVKTPPKDGVVLSARTVIATSNRVIGGAQMNIDTTIKRTTILGNITSVPITVQGALLTGTVWENLNIQV